MKNLIFFLAFLCLGSVQAQEEIQVDLDDFSGIKVYKGLKVKLVEAKENKAIISGDESERVEFEIEDGFLKINTALESLWKDNLTEIELHFIEIDQIEARQDASVEFTDPYRSSNLSLTASEGADIIGEIEVENLNVKSLTGAEIELEGEARVQDIKIRAGGQYYARYLTSDDIEISISAGGVADINASEYVKTKVRAGGTVNVYGKPKTIEEDTLFGGTVNRKN